MVSSNCKLGINRVSLQRVSEVIKIAVILITDLPCVKSHSAGSGNGPSSPTLTLFLGRDASHLCDGARHTNVHSSKKKSACIKASAGKSPKVQ